MAAAASPPSPLGKGKPNFTMPIPPPLLHTRSGNEIYEAPHTPTGHAFTSPYSTPQGSPSKNRLPPGANELPDVFENAMRLDPASPTKIGRQQLSPHSPNRGSRQVFEESLDQNINRSEYSLGPGSPTRKQGKENTPPGVRQSKPSPNQAAVSRQEPYQVRDTDSGTKARYNPQRGLTPEELEKLQLPKVKRLANVTQLCESNALSLLRLSALYNGAQFTTHIPFLTHLRINTLCQLLSENTYGIPEHSSCIAPRDEDQRLTASRFP